MEKTKALADQDTVAAASAVAKEYVDGEGGKARGKDEGKGTTEKLDNVYGTLDVNDTQKTLE